MSVEEIRLTPCRWCGKAPELYQRRSRQMRDGRDRVWRCRCRTRMCKAKKDPIYYYHTQADAAYAWNRLNKKSSPG